jgi:hypothetical protein
MWEPGGWPADGPISDGTVGGDHISFRVYGKQPSSSGYPKMRFTGTTHGDDMEFAMMLFYRDDESDAVRSDFKGKRVKR